MNYRDVEGKKSWIRTHNPLNAQKMYTYAQADYHAKYVSVRTSRLTRKIRIRTNNQLNAQISYNLHKSKYIRTSCLTHTKRTTYATPLPLGKVVHICTQKTYKLRKSAYISQSRTHTYAKDVQHTQSCIHSENPYKYIRKRRTYIYKIITDKLLFTKT